jgi:hypothetical protein
MSKTEIYKWRLSPRLKADLQEAARIEQKSLAELLDQIARDWLERLEVRGKDDDEQQRRVRKAAMRSVGAIQGGNPDRAASAGSQAAR